MAIDVHAHYIPQSLIASARTRGCDMGVSVVDNAGTTPALEFSYGFKVRPFFPKLIETAAERIAWLDSQRLDRQFVATWPYVYEYSLPCEKCRLASRAQRYAGRVVRCQRLPHVFCWFGAAAKRR